MRSVKPTAGFEHHRCVAVCVQVQCEHGWDSGFHRQCQSAFGPSGLPRVGCAAGQGTGWYIFGWRSSGRDRGKRPTSGGFRHPADLRANGRALHGIAGVDRRAEARISGQRHGGGPLFWLRTARSSPAFGTCADHRKSGCQDVLCRRCGSRADC